MMIDFEDKAPAPPLSRSEQLLLVLSVISSIYGLASGALTLARAMISVTSSIF